MIRFDDITKRRIILGVGIVVVALVAYGFGRSGNKPLPTGEAMATVSVSPTGTLQPSVSPTPTGPTAIPPKPKKTPLPTASPAAPYVKLSQCVASPSSLTLKTGAAFVLENLDTTARKISVSTQIFNMLPYAVAAATAPAIGTYSIVCDGVGVATIFVQP